MSVSYKLSLQVFHSALAVVPLKRAVGDGATVSSGVVKRASKLQPSSAERRLSQQYSLYGGKKESNNKKKSTGFGLSRARCAGVYRRSAGSGEKAEDR